MAKQDERNLNITLKTEEEREDEVVISISQVFKKLKKYFLIWLVTAVVAFVAVFGCITIKTVHSKPTLNAVVNFTYSGIEKGLAPDGRDFNKDSVKSPVVIEKALTSLNMPMDELESIRQAITVEGLVPADAMDKILVYRNVYENANSNNLQAAQSMLNVEIYPTNYRIYFDYAQTSLSRRDAVLVLNTILEQYKEYFFDMYGYNESLGSAVTSIDVSSYDYSEAVDVLKNSLDTMSKYVKQLSSDDTTRFRSSVTGYTFSDLYESIRTVKDIDLDKLYSFINVNNLTKDKKASIAYYEYRINELTRQKTATEEQLASVKDSINAYEKDQIIIFGNGTDTTDTQTSQASAQYDRMIAQKIELTDTLATIKQNINFCTERKDALKKSSESSEKNITQVEEQFADVNAKIDKLIEDVNLTADDYYENVTFRNAYSVLVPAVNSAGSTLGNIINNLKMPLILVEGLVFVLYFLVAFVQAIIAENKQRKRRKFFEEDMTEKVSASGDKPENTSTDIAGIQQ
ncbi:MAG: lipopolysaccharide biosynthesis protein [Ruminococcus sp.]|nr:lipopolysaccharide biosynthesis protein [Ruminococcus sp.]